MGVASRERVKGSHVNFGNTVVRSPQRKPKFAIFLVTMVVICTKL